MSIHRRGFLAGLAGGAAALGCKPAAAPKVDAWSDVRALFALSPDWIHLSALLLVSHPKPVRDAIDRLRRALDADPVRTMHEHEGTWRMHETAAAYMGVRREEILTSTHDHYSLHEATRLCAVRTGATVRRVPMWAEPSRATDAEMLASITKNLGDATRLVAWLHRWALPEAFEFHLAIGKERIRDRTHALNRALKQGFAAMKHLTLRTPLDDARSAGIVCFDVSGLEPEAVVKRLAEQRIVATATANTPSHARLSAAIFNTEGEVERVLSAIAAL